MVKEKKKKKFFGLGCLIWAVVIFLFFIGFGLFMFEAYKSAEIQKCSLGETTTMDGSLTCSELNAANVVAAAVIAKDDVMNAYETDKQAVTSGGTNTSDSDAGYIRLSVSGENIIIKTCHKKPCLTKNQSSKTIAFQ